MTRLRIVAQSSPMPVFVFCGISFVCFFNLKNRSVVGLIVDVTKDKI